MGMFDSLFGAKTKTTVNMPSWVKGTMKNYSGSVNNVLKQDPHSFFAPASGLQNLAFQQAQNLGNDWRPAMNTALGAVQAASSAPAASAGVAAQTGPAAQAGVSTYQAPNIGSAAGAKAVSIAPIERVQGQSLLDNFQNYMDPATQALVNTTLADYNNSAAQARASEEAKLAGQGAWGSGGQFYMSNFDVNNALKGANLENQLRSQAYTQAMNASNLDAGRRQDAFGLNAGAFNTRAGHQADLGLQRNMFNAGQSNDYRIAQGGLDAQAGQFNAGAANQAGMFNAGATNQLGMFNTGQTNDMSQYNANLQNDQYNRALQGAGMQGDIANSMAGNSRGDTALVGSLGDMQHNIDQAYASAPLSVLSSVGGMLNPLTQTFGQNQTSTPSPFTVGLQMAQFIPGMPKISDRRLKTDIEEIGFWDDKGDGLKKYRYRYRNDPSKTMQVGVMADEVKALRPQAYVPNFIGQYDGVNYAALGE